MKLSQRMIVTSIKHPKMIVWLMVKFKNDFLADPVVDDYLADLRELSLIFFPLDFVDVKIGRQVLTWGTGDLLFMAMTATGKLPRASIRTAAA
jgi:hypothetical protein